MDPSVIASPLNAGIAIGNAVVPVEGPKAVPYQLDFSKSPNYSVDLYALINNKSLSVIQCAYIDNSANTEEVSLLMVGTQQVITAPAGSQGYYPILAPKSGLINVASTGSALVKLFLINAPLPAGTWAPAQAGSVNPGSGALQTEDVNLAGIIDPVNGLKVQGSGGGGGGGAQLPYASSFYNGSYSNYDGQWNGFVLPSQAGKSFYLTQLLVTVDWPCGGRYGAFADILRIQNMGDGGDLLSKRFVLEDASANPVATPDGVDRRILFDLSGVIKLPFNSGAANVGVRFDPAAAAPPVLSNGEYVIAASGFFA